MAPLQGATSLSRRVHLGLRASDGPTKYPRLLEPPDIGAIMADAKGFQPPPQDDEDRTEALVTRAFMAGPTPDVQSPTHRPILICLAGSQRGQRHKLDKRETFLGRSREVEFKVEDMRASRRHLCIYYENIEEPEETPVCFVEDLESRNGTELNGKKITGRVRLTENDRIGIGDAIFGFYLRDEMELRQQESLYRRATRDPLTGLFNRHQLNARLYQDIQDAHRYGTPLCFMVIDIDHFKSINDTWGHAIGDMVLRHVARVLEQDSRDKDFVARWGGEEFAIAMAGTPAADGLAQAELVRSQLQKFPLCAEGARVSITVSIGVSLLRNDDNADTLFQRADKCLYEAKQGGRNRVVFGDYEPTNNTPAPL